MRKECECDSRYFFHHLFLLQFSLVKHCKSLNIGPYKTADILKSIWESITKYMEKNQKIFIFLKFYIGKMMLVNVWKLIIIFKKIKVMKKDSPISTLSYILQCISGSQS